MEVPYSAEYWKFNLAIDCPQNKYSIGQLLEGNVLEEKIDRSCPADTQPEFLSPDYSEERTQNCRIQLNFVVLRSMRLYDAYRNGNGNGNQANQEKYKPPR